MLVEEQMNDESTDKTFQGEMPVEEPSKDIETEETTKITPKPRETAKQNDISTLPGVGAATVPDQHRCCTVYHDPTCACDRSMAAVR